MVCCLIIFKIDYSIADFNNSNKFLFIFLKKMFDQYKELFTYMVVKGKIIIITNEKCDDVCN